MEPMITDATAPAFPIASLRVEPWPDPVIDAVGHDVRSPYVERFWLGLLGPSSSDVSRAATDDLSSGCQRQGFHC